MNGSFNEANFIAPDQCLPLKQRLVFWHFAGSAHLRWSLFERTIVFLLVSLDLGLSCDDLRLISQHLYCYQCSFASVIFDSGGQKFEICKNCLFDFYRLLFSQIEQKAHLL